MKGLFWRIVVLDLASLELNEGEVPQRPTKLKSLRMVSLEGFAFQWVDHFIGSGRAVVIGGTIVPEDTGSSCPVIGIYKLSTLEKPEEAEFLGWTLVLGSQEIVKEDFGLHYYSSNAPSGRTVLQLPRSVFFLVGEVDSSLTEESANLNELGEIFRYLLPFIREETSELRKPRVLVTEDSNL